MNILEGVKKKRSEPEKNTAYDAKIRQMPNDRDEEEAMTRSLMVEERKVVIHGSRYMWESSDVWDRQELYDQQPCKRGTGEGDLKDTADDKS